MRKEELYFDSRDNVSKIHAVKWIPDETPVSILQIVHGMAEYIERYEEFANFLVERNVLVVGEDHLGHGKSIGNNPKGYFCKRDAATVIVRDVHRLKKLIQQEYPTIPYFILGHSMGSLMARNYLFKYGNGINGAIICATCMTPKPLLILSDILIRILTLFQGEKHESKLLNQIGFGTYLKKIENPVSNYDWISRDAKEVEKYNDNPLCGFIFTLNGFKTLKDLSLRLYDMNNLGNMPKDLPISFIYGTEDPVGNYGVSVKDVYASFIKLGMKDVTIKAYEGDRHELLNEIDRETVMMDIYKWIISKLKE